MNDRNRLAYANIWQFYIDILFLILSFYLTYFLASNINQLQCVWDCLWILIAYTPIWLFSMTAMGMYNMTRFNYLDRIFRHIVLSTIIAGCVIALIVIYTDSIYFNKLFYTLFTSTTILIIFAERYLWLILQKKFHNKKVKNVIIIGTQGLVDKFEYFIKKTQILINIIGYIQIHEDIQLKSKNCLGSLDDLAEILKNSVVDEVVIAIPKKYIDMVEKCVLTCEEMGITTRLVLDLYTLKIAQTFSTSLGTLPMITFHTVSLNDLQASIKRIIDIFGAIIGLIITAIISIFVIPAILIDSKGSVLFKQDRVGLNGRVFKIYKFRSMTCDAEAHKHELAEQNQISGGLMFKVCHDPRVTTVGRFLRKTSIDELPQFWNVLKGDMSLVGTRPPTLDEVSKYLNGHRRRISIKPGLTGLWQISGRSSIVDFNEVVRLDTDYIDKWSVAEDFKIILKTIPALLARRGAM